MTETYPLADENESDSGGEDGGGLARNSAAVAGWTLLSRVSGFVRVGALAAVLGPTRFGDLFLGSNLLPNYTHELVAGSLLTALLMPHLVTHLDRGDGAALERIASGFLTTLVLVTGALSVLVIAAGPLVVPLLSLGASGSEVQSDLLRVGWPLLALLLPQVMFYGIATVGAAVQNAHGRFGLAAAAPVVENFAIIGVVLVAAGVWGTGTPVSEVSLPQVLFLGGGTTTAVVLHAALQWFGARRCGVTLRPRRGWRDPEVGEILTRARAAAGYTALNVARLLAMLVVAGLVEGGIVAFQFGLNFFNLPVAIIAKPVTTAAVPVLSRLQQAGRSAAARTQFIKAGGLVLMLAMPATAGLIALARPIAELVAFGEMSGGGAVLAAAAIGSTAMAIPGESLQTLAAGASYARLDGRAPLVAMASRVVVLGLGAAVSAFMLEGPALLIGLGLSMALSDTVGAARLVSAVAGRPRNKFLSMVGSHLITGCFVWATVSWVVWLVGQAPDQGRVSALVAVGCGGVVAAVIGAGMPLVRNASELSVSPRLAELGNKWAMSPRELPVEGRRPSDAGFLALLGMVVAAAAGAVAVFLGALGAVAALGIGLIAGIVWRPVVAPLALLGTTPIIVGMVRGTFVPLLRANEALLAIVVVALVLRLVFIGPDGPRPRFQPLDVAIAAFGVAGTILPLLVGAGRGVDLNSEDVTQAAVPLKLAVLYAVFRLTVTRRRHVKWCALTTIAVGLPVAAIALAQSMGVGIVTEILLTNWDPAFPAPGRGAATIGNPIALGDVMAVHFALVLFIFLGRNRRNAAAEPGANHESDGRVREGARSGARRSRPGFTTAMATHPSERVEFGPGGEAGNPHGAGSRSVRAGSRSEWGTSLSGRRWAGLAVVGFGLGAVGSGQFSGLLAVAICAVVAVALARSLPALIGAPIAGGVGLLALWPVVAARLEGFQRTSGLPKSWEVRFSNLERHYLTEFESPSSILLGVRPDTSIDLATSQFGEIYLEQGYLWLLWVGGVVLLAAFGLLLVVAGRTARRAVEHPDRWVAAVACATYAGICALVPLTMLDPHLTFRGMSDLMFALMAITAGAVSFRGPATESRVESTGGVRAGYAAISSVDVVGGRSRSRSPMSSVATWSDASFRRMRAGVLGRVELVGSSARSLMPAGVGNSAALQLRSSGTPTVFRPRVTSPRVRSGSHWEAVDSPRGLEYPGGDGVPAPPRPKASRRVLEAWRFGDGRHHPVGRLMKRTMDVVLSALLLVCLSPILLLIAAAIKRTSPGPVLFKQERVGFREEPFTIWKFRTMSVHNDESAHREYVQSLLAGEGDAVIAEDGSEVFKLVDDPRITPIGRFLRRTSLDELPQLVNVLTGSMSLVGPRPSLDYELDCYSLEHRLRASAVPGMTGLTQVKARNDVDMLTALDMDLEYVRTCTLRGDVRLLFATVGAVVRSEGS